MFWGTSGSLSNVIIFCLQYVYSGWKRLFQSTGYRYMLERSMPKQGADFMRTVKSVCVHSLSASELSTLALSMNKLLLIYISLALCRFHLSLLERINNHRLVFSLLTWMFQGNLFRLPLCIIACSLLILRFFKPFFSPSIL